MQTYRQKHQQKSDLGFRRNIILFVYLIAWGQGQLRESQERAQKVINAQQTTCK